MKYILILLFLSSFNLYAQDFVEEALEKRYGKTGEDVVVGKTGASVDANKDHLPKINPIISANFLMLYDYSQELPQTNGFKIQEVLLQFGATVDKVFEAEVFVGIEQLEDRETFDVFPVGVFAETRRGDKFNFRAGQFLNHFGEHNSRYKHNFPFILAPLINEELFGERGLNFIGLGVDWKSLFRDHVEFTIEFTQGKNPDLFHDDNNHYLASLRILGKHLLGDKNSLKPGISLGAGEIQQWLWGADISYDHVFHPDHNFHIRGEYLGKNKEDRQGLYGLVQYRFLQTWEVGYRYDYAGLEKDRHEPINQRHSLLLAALPTYFSGVRFEYTRETRGDGFKDNRLLFQLNQTVGPRRAHSY